MNTDIICLQETHLVNSDFDTLLKEWNIEYIINGNSTNSKGVAILLNKTFEYNLNSTYKDKDSRYIILNITINNLIPILIVNIYGPNNDNPSWFENLFNKIEELNIDHIIIVGDWNTTLNNNDTYNYNIQRNIKSRQYINNYITKNKFIDIWRSQNQDSKRYTWGTKKPFKRARLDYFIISQDILAFAPKAEINNAYRSDHNLITLKLNINSHPRGKGSWKFNNKLLTSIEYINLIKKTINLNKNIYALPIYDVEFINKDNGETLEINIADSLFLNNLLCQIRGETIKFSKNLSRINNKIENELVDKITNLEIEIDCYNINLQNKLNELNTANTELQSLREDKLRGHQIRSRYQHIKDWEKPSNYFLNLEKKNYLNKNIAELIDTNDRTIRDPNKILKLQSEFYSDLFLSRHVNRETDSRYSHFLENLPKLNDNSKQLLNQPISLSEVEEVIKQGKNNKSPGPDGFSNELFKFFHRELKYWIWRTFKEAIITKSFTGPIIEGTITCIPKAGKERNVLKNWRPLTLLNSTYKYFSSIIANRIKPLLSQIINPDQTGFISGRFLGENTRLLADTLEYCESNSIDGLLIVVDYAKAFDTIEWNFIENCLNLFGFSEFIVDSVKLLQKNSFSRIEQNGHFSENISLSRGCRQGDPISPYLFVICAEVLSHVIRENPDIKGIKIGETEIKLSQYADDTTIFLDKDKNSLKCVMDVLRWFNKLSGLAINKDKTKVIKIGATRDRKIPWEGQFGLNWTHTFEVLGIYYDVFRLSDLTEINLDFKIEKIKKLIRTWSSRQLTPYGKVTIVKSLLLSKITHILLSLPSPKPSKIKMIESIFNSFIWSDKPAKFSKHILEADIAEGGLKLHNLTLFDKALKLGWLRRYLTSNGKWKVFLDIEDFHEIFNYGPDYVERMVEIIDLPFWQDVLSGLQILYKSSVCNELSVVCLTPLWYNNSLRLPIKPGWLKKGITTISDVLNENCLSLSLEEFQEKYGISSNFLEYGGFTLTLKLFLDVREKPSFNVTRPANCLLNSILCRDLKGVSRLYKSLLGKRNDITTNICQKWYDKANTILSTYEVRNSFILTNRLIDDIYLKYIHFRTLHYRFFTNDVLVKCKILSDDTCSICKLEKDSNYHMLIDCVKVRELWTEVERWIQTLGMVDYHLTDRKKILGDLENSWQINIILLNVKKAIYKAKLDCKKPTLLHVQLNLRQVYKHEYYKSIINDKQVLFERNWSLLLNFFKYKT